eukprot:466317_1
MGNKSSKPKTKCPAVETRRELDILTINGFSRLNAIHNIPSVILDVILTFYYVHLEHITFPIFAGEFVCMSKNNTDFKAIRGDWEPNRMASADIGYNSGYHVWKIKCIQSDMRSNQAIGVWSDYEDAFSPLCWFGNNARSHNYFWHGYNRYGIFSVVNNVENRIESIIVDGWTSGDVLTVILDCDNWTMCFQKNDEDACVPFNIAPDITYYPAFVCTGHNDHYRAIHQDLSCDSVDID